MREAIFLRKIAIRFLSSFFLCCAISAQAANVSDLPDALKGIKQADGVCRKSDFLPKPSRVINAQDTNKANMSCALAPLRLKNLMDRQDTVLVDIRPSTDFMQSRINGALNISLASIQTKPFLRNKTVVLIGNGKNEAELYASCANLRSEGFKHLYVLHGGMPAWLMEGDTSYVQGDVEASPPVLAASELWAESQFQANAIVFNGENEWKNVFPSAVPLRGESATFIRTLMDKRSGRKSRMAINAVILIVNKEISLDELENLRKASRPATLLIHIGTVQNYKKQMAQQNAIWAAQARGPKQPGCGL